MSTEATEPPKRSYDALLGEVNTKFNALIDSSRKDSAPLDLTRSGTLLPDFKNFCTYLETIRTEADALDIQEKFREELIDLIDSRLSTVNEYTKILQDVEDRKKGSV
ncbi:hypothetical protein HY732_00845 [Candidatus Uhrbacteria bacterium]|nr:hypothetical protein [Candidatus Uhrbacteria bacterium]